ncbi:MAG: DUF4129 domain-containing protein [Planctomycetota bacterium]
MKAIGTTLLITILVVSGRVSAQSESENTSTFTDGVVSDSIWYDADEGAVVPIDVVPETDDSLNRNSRWLPKAKRVEQPKTTNTGGTGGGGGGGTGAGVLGTGLSIGNVFGWVLLVALFAGGIALLLFAISKSETDLSNSKNSSTKDLLKSSDEQLLERMKHLPKELRRTDVNLRSEAERLMGEGEYDQAIILLFGHQLLLLDRVGMLRLNRGKTNRRYVRETRRSDSEAARILKSTVYAFERSYFGRHSIQSDQFQSLWHSNEILEGNIQRQREAAA